MENEYIKFTIGKKKDIALIAHDNEKPKLIEWCKENYDIFSFSLDEEDMNLIATLDKQTSSFFSHQDPKMIEWFGDLIIQRRGK